MTEETVRWDVQLTGYVEEQDGLIVYAQGLGRKSYTFHFRKDTTRTAWFLDDNGVSAQRSYLYPRNVKYERVYVLEFNYYSKLHRGNRSVLRNIVVAGSPGQLRQIYNILRYITDPQPHALSAEHGSSDADETDSSQATVEHTDSEADKELFVSNGNYTIRLRV